ncbi:hypothetical protein RF11_10957 [Thelohanellus kitauei]|uniref:Uncharacterized protein n=1 Tax=Thelohanellus kitauei TaxID=669202 RepID=A0A0C2I6A3_THEKT|nr:hypothetical protein RF11_10957 [Thelohanellus kitauei]
MSKTLSWMSLLQVAVLVSIWSRLYHGECGRAPSCPADVGKYLIDAAREIRSYRGRESWDQRTKYIIKGVLNNKIEKNFYTWIIYKTKIKTHSFQMKSAIYPSLSQIEQKCLEIREGTQLSAYCRQAANKVFIKELSISSKEIPSIRVDPSVKSVLPHINEEQAENEV